MTYFSPSWRSTVDLMNTWLHWMLTMPVISMFLNFFRFCLVCTFRWSHGAFCVVLKYYKSNGTIYQSKNLLPVRLWVDFLCIPDTQHRLDSMLYHHKGRRRLGRYFWHTCWNGGSHLPCIGFGSDVWKKEYSVVVGNTETKKYTEAHAVSSPTQVPN